jgi:hypothetical protein
MTEQNGAFSNIGGGYVTSYKPAPQNTLSDPTLNPPSPSYLPVAQPLSTTTTDPCWITLTADQKLAFVSSAAGTVSSFAVGFDGKLTMLHPAATAPDGVNDTADLLGFGITDLASSRDGKYVYQLHSFEGALYVFLVNPNGLLTFVERHEVFDLTQYVRNEGPPLGISAY